MVKEMSLMVPLCRIAVAIFAALAAHNVYLKHGFKFSTEWVQRIMPDPLFMQLFLSLVLILNRPYLLGMATIVLGAVSTFSDKILRVSHSYYGNWYPSRSVLIVVFPCL
jgi:hypothetical protein